MKAFKRRQQVRLNGSQGAVVERSFGSMMKYVTCLGNILWNDGTAAFLLL